jgi:hypothetical protein
MLILIVVIIALAVGFAVFLAMPALRSGRRRDHPVPEALLLEEAVVTQPVAPGMEGMAEVRELDAKPLVLRIRATDASQAFARGTRVRVIDCRDGCYFIENADEEHLVR